MVSTHSMQPFSMNVNTNRSPLSPTDEQMNSRRSSNSSVVREIRIKSELTWPQLIHAEIIAVTSAMRKNARWSGMSVSGLRMGGLGNSMGLRSAHMNTKDSHTKEDNPLMEGFTNLRTYLKNVNDVRDVDAVNLLNPFLEVIRSGNTTGPIAGTALGSVEKFLNYGIIGIHSPRIALAMNAVSSAATHCKFEASDSASDELVLLRMLQVLQMAIASECGQVLSDEAVCEMMETGLSMCCQMRLSEMLRRSAEHVMINMVIAIFERLKNLEDEWQFVETPGGGNTDDQAQQQLADPHMSTPKPSSSPTLQSYSPTSTENNIEKMEESLIEDTENKLAIIDEKPTNATATVAEPNSLKAYGLPAIRELLRVLISLLNPYEHKHTDSMRLMALSILNIAFEVGGKSIGRFESLRSLITDDFCKYVFQLTKTDSTPLLALSLRVISTVFSTLRPWLKLQQELFIFFLIERLSPPQGTGIRNISADVDEEGNVSFTSTKIDGPKSSPTDTRSSSPNGFLGKSTDYPRQSKNHASSEQTAISIEVRELLLESLLQFARVPSFMVGLWYNYDCDLTCGDLFEELIQFLSKNSFPDHNSYSIMNNYHMLCLDTLLMFITQMVERGESQELEEDYVELINVQELLDSKTKKRLVLKGTSLFNESPKKGIKSLVENGIVIPEESGDIKASLSHYFRCTQQLDKKRLGEYLGRLENFDTLKVYMQQFDFQGKRMDEALRMVLETFRLPGESQQIIRVTDTFAETFFQSGTPEIYDVEAAQVLAYSVIMLNTDQHSPQVKVRMSLDQYIRNVRGVNNKGDFPKEYLELIYKHIHQDEILMPEEHEGMLGFSYAWKQLQHRSASAKLFITCDTGCYDKAVFELAWKPMVAAISYVFSTAQDDETLQKAITGFHHCANLAAQFKLYDVFDSIVINLATMTGLLNDTNGNISTPDPIVDVAGQKYVVSKLAVRFGRNYKGQLAAVVLFAIVTRQSNSLRKGWVKILQIIRNLFLNSLLPSSMLQVEDFISGTSSIPLKPKSPKPVKQVNRRDGSLLSTLSSYLLSPYSGEEADYRDPTKEEVESTMCAVDCVAACKLEELFTDIGSLEVDVLKSLLKSIQSVGYNTETMKKATVTIPYDPATVLFLELMVTIVARNADRIEELWPYATEYVSGIFDFVEKQSVLVVERSVVGLLRLCICSASQKDMLNEIVKSLQVLRDFPPSVMQAVAEQMMAGIFKLSSVNSENRDNAEFLNTVLEIKQKVANSL